MTNAAWSSDLLGRKSDAKFLIDFLIRKIEERGKRGQSKSFVLNIDAGWGQGKTYFLQNLRLTLEEHKHVVAYVNAWTDDHADDPLIAVISAIETSVKKCSGRKDKKPLSKLTQVGGKLAAAAAKGLIKQAVKRYAGEDTLKELTEIAGNTVTDLAKSAGEEVSKTASELYDSEGKALLEKFHTGQKTIVEFRKQLGSVIKSLKLGHKLPLFILVDELDRCRPLYAIALLERVKHLFEVDDVVFVMATDTGQLRHSIGAIYGLNFAADNYLLRFFDQTYRFEDASVDAFVEHQFSDIDDSRLFGSPNVRPAKFVAKAFEAFHLSLRDIEQCMDIIRNCVSVWPGRSDIELLVLLPLVIMQQQRMIVGYENAREQLERQRGRIQWYDLDFDIYRGRERELFDGLTLFAHIVERATKFPLVHFCSEDAGSLEDKVCKRVLMKEFQARFPSGLTPNSTTMSLIRNYPKLVRSVGRLSLS